MAATTKDAKPAENATLKATSTAEGIIRPEELYTLSTLSARCGLGRWGLREARGAGLKVLRFHGRVWVKGAAFIAFLEQQNAEGKAPKQKESAGQEAETDSHHGV